MSATSQRWKSAAIELSLATKDVLRVSPAFWARCLHLWRWTLSRMQVVHVITVALERFAHQHTNQTRPQKQTRETTAGGTPRPTARGPEPIHHGGWDTNAPPDVRRAVIAQLRASHRESLTAQEVTRFMVELGVPRGDARGALTRLRSSTGRDNVTAADMEAVQAWVSRGWLRARELEAAKAPAGSN